MTTHSHARTQVAKLSRGLIASTGVVAAAPSHHVSHHGGAPVHGINGEYLAMIQLLTTHRDEISRLCVASPDQSAQALNPAKQPLQSLIQSRLYQRIRPGGLMVIACGASNTHRQRIEEPWFDLHLIYT